jgi:hydroxymethylbilane synthase
MSARRERAPTSPVRVGTRGSALARSQTSLVTAGIVGELGRKVETVEIVTAGDRSSAAVTEMGGTGVFVSALRDALLAGEIDVAVHSYKDLPTAPAAGLAIAAVPPREDPRDVLVARAGLTLGELPRGATVGTGSPRRAAQLRALGLGLEVVPIRGNVDTRLRKVAAGELDAVVLARAGLARLDRLDEVTEALDPLQMLPAPAQGALAVETRSPPSSPCSTPPIRGSRSRPSGRCSPRSRPAAPLPSAGWPRSPSGRTDQRSFFAAR